MNSIFDNIIIKANLIAQTESKMRYRHQDPRKIG